MMSKSILFVFMVLLLGVSHAQTRDSIVPINQITPLAVKNLSPPASLNRLKRYSKRHPNIKFWKSLNRIGVDLSEVAFVNWNAGGANSVAGLVNVDLKRIYERKNLRWNNELIARYGINQQKGQELRKTDDHLEINSTFGYRKDTLSNWYSSAKMNFSTQFSNGYNYPDISNKISTVMAPAYFFLGAGSEYNDEKLNLNIYASPLTLRSTFVLDQELANNGSFGVEPAIYDEDGNLIKEGRNTRTELGILITNEYNIQLFENIGLTNKLSLYTDYINKFGNIDVNWELNFNFKVNEFVLAKLGSHLKYDDDIKMQQENADGELVDGGPKVQWKQQLGIGVIVEL
ncbi:DUF3078 domain-containing protein [Mesonia sp. JHPTF-M18]|uniref:DUF3078 domain-containing protein n=2 Tax=Mesonia aestuariivivens TaxID=2796128 RepID=A0ABS6VZJ4_9FLAO|nr:DUF3078 domain-containing protein [Mesonia aestuariivivens]